MASPELSLELPSMLSTDTNENSTDVNNNVPTLRNQFDTTDLSVVAVYFILVLATGFYSMFRSNRGTVSGYFLAGRFMCWLPIGASLFASNIGSEHFIGLAGSGAASGIGVGAFEINALAIIQLTGWVFVPVFISSRVCTLPEYMSKRFGGQRIRTYLAVLSLILYVFTKISVNLFSGALFIQQALQWDLYIAISVLLTLTAICTVTGGLAAVMYTDTLQCFVMLTGAVIVAIKAFIMVGGYTGLREKYAQAIPSILPNGSICGIPDPKNSWKMLRSWDDPDMPWLGFILGQTPASIWYWCTDQMMVQRLLAAKSLSHAQGGTLFAGFMKILPLFLIVMPGMISRVLFPDEVGCAVPEICEKYCGNRAGCSNIAYPRLVLEIMPTGLRGLMMAVMLAALMSDLTSVYNSASTLFTMDIWPQIRKRATVWELMIVGRLFVIIMVIISIAWIPVIQNMQGGQLYIYIQSVAAYLAPPIAAVYLLAVLWKPLNEQGTFWSLMLGFMVGVVRMILDFAYPKEDCGKIDTRPYILRNVHYMYFAFVLFWITALSAIIISLMTEPPDPYRLIRATFWTRYARDDREDEKGNLGMQRTGSLREEFSSPEFSDTEIDEKENLPNEKTNGIDIEIRPPINRRRQNVCLFYMKKSCNWFCGFNRRGDQKDEEISAHLNKIASLHQTKHQKLTLSVLLLVELTIVIFFFTYFSLDFDDGY